MSLFTIVFLVLLFTSLAVQIWLGQRNAAYILDKRGQVPEDFRKDVTLEEHQKAADYTIAKGRLNHYGLGYDALLLLILLPGGGLDFIDHLWQGTLLGPIERGVCVILSLILVLQVAHLPFSIYGTFVLEEKFGFNRTTIATFTGDKIKSNILALVIGGPLIALVLWLMEVAGAAWWLYAWLVWAGVSLLSLWAYPALIAPLFNKFTPLENDLLATRIRDLATRCGFTIKGIFVMDGSKRSAHGNAYFTGLGANKRIVFFDTLMDSMKAEEIEAVLAHELGHFKRRHVQKLFLTSSLLTLGGFAVLGALAGEDGFYSGLGVSTPSSYMALVLFALVAPLAMVFLSPAFSLLSRRFEYEADDFASRMSNSSDLVSALVKLYRENSSTLTPDPLYSAIYHSHPPPSLRIAHLKAGQAP